MRIDAFLQESPMFAINRAPAARLGCRPGAGADGLGFLEGLVWRQSFSMRRNPPGVQLAETFGTTRAT